MMHDGIYMWCKKGEWGTCGVIVGGMGREYFIVKS